MIRSRLFRKTLVFFIILFGVVANVSALYSGWLLYNRISQEYESKAVAIARSVAHSDIEIVAKSDAAHIQSKIDQYLDLEGVSYVLVTDADGEVLAHTFIPVIPDPVLAVIKHDRKPGELADDKLVQHITLPRGDVIHVGMPILAGAGGYVYIGMDRSIIVRYIWQAALQQQALTMVIFVVSAIVAFLFIRSISMPLMSLTEYANRVAAHDFSGSIDIRTKDEVGALAQTMQSMSRDLAALVGNLEMAVEEKTQELSETVAYISAIIGNITEGLLVVDADGRVANSNAALERMFGCSALEGLSVEQAFIQERNPHANAELVGALRRVLTDGHCITEARAHELETVCCRVDGGEFPAEISLVCFERDGVRSLLCLMRDVTERRRIQESLRKSHDILEQKVAERTRELSRMNSQLMLENAERKVVEQALRRTEERYRSIFENSIEGIFQTSPEGRLINANPALARIFGYASPQEIMTEVADVGKDIYARPEDRRAFVERIGSEGSISDFEFKAKRRCGGVIWVTTSARTVHDRDGRLLYYEGFIEDMTVRKEALERLEHQAYHDPLTGLPNRLLFQDHLAMALSRVQRRLDYAFAVLYLDLDRFKMINDSLGHATGDKLLCHVSTQLRSCVREVDTVARFGGDEFAILLEEITAPREAVRIARRILETLGTPVDLDGHEVFTSASVGIVLKTARYANPQEVLRDADTAMYRAKEMGKARFKVFNQRMHEAVLRIMALETELRKAVERKELYLQYQPIIDISEGRICGFEALVRWQHETLGFISPAEFIPLAEDSGLIGEIGDFVFEQAVSDLKKWNTPEGIALHGGLYVCVNISGRQFMQPDFAGHVEYLIREWNANPEHLRFEITESVLMEQVSFVAETIARLRSFGVRMCIDDFGTGYSSLSYLQRLPVDTIKIDRSFIAQLQDDKEGRSIVRSILSLGHSLGLDVIAEGVESLHQEQLLEDMECRYLQGFLYSSSLSCTDVDSLLAMKEPLAYLRVSTESGDFKDVSGL
ncbi:EAL domain-containing protein [Desulfovibrio mangrovi]|uniref:EAL domain-containing protein n=1 Tax=Desulfovibrio mangrovi TaxID=2976983 RepID=UPI00224547FD|nr:EAL domain-containing protein [Desulfovibrio mangrovi]UZP68564.1 EAL domain-containing protein [Desulfovibrio mangrovi]